MIKNWHDVVTWTAPFRVFFSGVLLSLICLSGACRSLPEPAEERAVYIDLRQIVETRERSEWLMDNQELEEAQPKAMQSVCRVPSETIASLERWLDDQIESQGGPPVDQFDSGAELDSLGEALTLQRVQRLARQTDAARAACPFWIDAGDDFNGVHRPTNRFVLLAESAGAGSLIMQGDQILLGAGGAGRLLAAWGLGDRYLLAFGGEVGGAAGLEPLNNAENDEIETRIHAAVPLMFRVHDLARFYDVELAATALASPRNLEPSPGLRAQLGAGILTVRISQFLPYFSLIAGYEVLPWEDPAVHIFRLGTRFGVDFDPSAGGP
jgi:hypothetical protein